jgi:EmrB/QacA subfamily drug resistance transporter
MSEKTLDPVDQAPPPSRHAPGRHAAGRVPARPPVTPPVGPPDTAPTVASGGDNPYMSHREILVVLFGIMAGMLLAALDQSIVGTALPRIVSDLGGLDKLSWVVTAYLLTSTASTPLWGKISDLYGRRPIFQSAIIIFLAGSLLAGFSHNMEELIGFRAIQGLGAGGLMALAFAIIGDVIPPRERGRYQGYFGAVFGVSSVAGPLLGGWLTDGPGWHWIFWLNIPIGLVALVITSYALKMPRIHQKATVDWAGAGLIVGAVSALLLYLSWRGKTYGWTEGWALVLLIGGLALAAIFVLVENKVSEPIIPMRLFKNRTFSVGNVFGFIMGFGMFGGIIYLPVYLQVVKGWTPTHSGLAMLPMVVGIFSTSISSGRLMSKNGHYRIYPILGGAIMTIAMALMSTFAIDTPFWTIAFFEFLLGAGLGFSMQTITVAVQNAIQRRDMGVATSAVTFFRSMGGAFGTAIFGAVLTTRLTHHLTDTLPASVVAQIPAGATSDISKIAALPDAIKGPVLDAFMHAIQDVFRTGVPFMAMAFVVAFFLKEISLKGAHPEPAAALDEEEAPVAVTPH